MKRVIRSVLRNNDTPTKFDIVIMVKKNFTKKDYSMVSKDIHDFIDRYDK